MASHACVPTSSILAGWLNSTRTYRPWCAFKTLLLLLTQGLVSTGTSFYHPASGLTVRQLSVSADGGSATVTVCRNSTAAETGALCFNGLDDDCDGTILVIPVRVWLYSSFALTQATFFGGTATVIVRELLLCHQPICL